MLSCLVVSDSLQPLDCSPWSSSFHRIFQAKILEWVAIFSSRRSSWIRDRTCVSFIGRQILYHWATKKAEWSESRSVVSDFLWPHGLYSPWNSPGQNTGVGSLSLLQGIFPTQGLNPGLLHCRWILYQLSHKGSPRILEWVAYSFSSGSAQPRDRTGVSCIAGRFLTNWVIREAQATKETGMCIYTHINM